MSRQFIGIDPGLSGAISVLSDDGSILALTPMPITESGLVDLGRVYECLQTFSGAQVWLERAVAFKMGRTSAFNYGRGFGFLEAAILFSNRTVNYVMPGVWHKLLIPKEEGKEPKELAQKKALELWDEKLIPRGPKSGKLHDGIIDSLLIAEYGRRQASLS